DVHRRSVVKTLRRVEAQSVETKLADPIGSVGNEEIAYRTRLGAVEVDAITPFGLGGEIGMRETSEVIAVGTQMVINDVEYYGHPRLMRGVDKRTHIMRTAVIVRGRIQAYAVVAPVETAGELVDRHQLDHGYAQLGQGVELVDRGEKRSLAREGPDM